MTSVPAKSYVAAEMPEWLYPGVGDQPPPLGAKVQLLTIGHVAVHGPWTDDGRYIAWAPLLKRNKEKEARLASAASAM